MTSCRCSTLAQAIADELAGQAVLVDVRSRQLRYVIVAPQHGKANVVIPWQALYFDSSLVRLVYYTYS